MRATGEPPAAHLLRPLQALQNSCLRKITRGYKRTPRQVLERETYVPPIDLHLEAARYRHANRIKADQVEAHIASTADAVWKSMRRARAPQVRPRLAGEVVALQAQAKIETARAAERLRQPRIRRVEGAHRPRRNNAQDPLTSDGTLIKHWMIESWRLRWESTVGNRRAAVWKTPWKQDPRLLYVGLPKANATALFLMRTEVIGLNAWLASIGVPDVYTRCACGWHAQTVRHVLMFCLLYDRVALLQQCGTGDFEVILQDPKWAKHAARWLVASGAMEQFRVAREMQKEQREEYRPFTKR